MGNNEEKKKLGPEGLGAVWTKVFSLIKIITGDVDVTKNGTIQEQITQLKNSLGGLNFKGMMQTEYDALESKDEDTIYFAYKGE